MSQNIAIITGAGSGIGAAIATELANRDLHSVIVDVDKQKAVETAHAIQATGATADVEIGDVTDAREVERIVNAVEQLGTVEVLVNNVGIVRDDKLIRMKEEDWDLVIDVNLKSHFLFTRAVAPAMLDRGYGRIVNITSRAWLGSVGQANYSSAKGGVVSLTRSSALEFASKGVTVNCVAPGLIDTPLIRGLSPEIQERLLAAQPTKKMGTPRDVAKAVAFLASQEASFITGQVLYVCGGKSIGTVF